MSANRLRTRAQGFTLIEILVAITLLTIVLAIVYGAYSSVVMSIERTQAAADRLRTTTFIVRAFTENLAQATEGWSPGSAYRSATGTTAATEPANGQEPQNTKTSGKAGTTDSGSHAQMRFPFMGEIGRAGKGGPSDELTFASTAPIAGGGTLPGQIKLCSYRLEAEGADDEEDESAVEEEPAVPGEKKKEKRMLLVMTETP